MGCATGFEPMARIEAFSLPERLHKVAEFAKGLCGVKAQIAGIEGRLSMRNGGAGPGAQTQTNSSVSSLSNLEDLAAKCNSDAKIAFQDIVRDREQSTYETFMLCQKSLGAP